MQFTMGCLLAVLLATIEAKQTVSVRGKVKTVLESVRTNCDHDFVEYFHQLPNQEMLYGFRVVKIAESFSINVIIRALTSQRIMLNVKDLDGCQFLNNPLISKVMAHTYRAIVANRSILKCPIPPEVYVLKNMGVASIIPTFHPAGHYQVNVRILMSQSPAPFVMEVIWKYNVIHLK